MKNCLKWILPAFILCLLLILDVGHAQEKGATKKLGSFKIDLLGDEKKERLQLRGIPFGKNTNYYRTFLLHVTSGKEKITQTIPGGFQPKLKFYDLNQDGKAEVLAEIPTGGSGGVNEYFAYAFQNGKAEKIKLPSPLNINGSYRNNYKAIIMIHENNQSYKLNLRANKGKYDKLGIYHDGKLNEPSETLVSEFTSLKLIDFDKDGKDELVGLQFITGSSVTDRLAKIQSIWDYKEQQWNLRKVNVSPVI